jgi:hypothetical protein
MSPTSYQAAPPRGIIILSKLSGSLNFRRESSWLAPFRRDEIVENLAGPLDYHELYGVPSNGETRSEEE